jgi:O-acetylserine/cysteine efflux transporter
MRTNRHLSLASLTTAGLLWGTTVPLTKLALAWLDPGWLTVIRFALAAPILMLFVTWKRIRSPFLGTTSRKLWSRTPSKATTSGKLRHPDVRRPTGLRAATSPAIVGWGAFGYGIVIMLQNAGIARTSVSHAALLVGGTPILVALLSVGLGRSAVGPVSWAGFVVALAGVAGIAADGGGAATLTGDSLVLASLVLSAGFVVAQPRMLVGRDPVAVTAVQFAAAAVAALPVAWILDGSPAVPGNSGTVLATAGLVVGGTLAPFTLFAYGQARVTPEIAGAFLNLEPVVGAMAGVVVFGDPVGLPQAVGGVAVLVGIALTALPLVEIGTTSRKLGPQRPGMATVSGRLCRSRGAATGPVFGRLCRSSSEDGRGLLDVEAVDVRAADRGRGGHPDRVKPESQVRDQRPGLPVGPGRRHGERKPGGHRDPVHSDVHRPRGVGAVGVPHVQRRRPGAQREHRPLDVPTAGAHKVDVPGPGVPAVRRLHRALIDPRAFRLVPDLQRRQKRTAPLVRPKVPEQ